MVDNTLSKLLNAVMLVSNAPIDKSIYEQLNLQQSQTIAPQSLIELSQNNSQSGSIDTLYIISIESYTLLPLLNAVHRLLATQGSVFIHSALLQHELHASSLLARVGFKYTMNSGLYQCWQKIRLPPWQLSFAEESSQEAISALFLDVFKHPLSAELWRWKYKKEGGYAVLAYKDNHLIGHYGGMCRDVFIANRPAKALQIGDVMVAQKQRGVLSKRGLFFQMCATFLEQYMGDNKPYALGYGFPTERAMRIAKHQGLYRQVDRMVEKHWLPLRTRASIFHVIRPLNKTPSVRVRTQIAHLWQHMLSDFSQAIIGVRDWDYLCYRYFSHPEKHYYLYRVNHRFSNTPIGIIVLSLEGERCRLMDIVSTQQAFPCLIHHARRLAYDLKAAQLFAWTTLSHQGLWPSDEGQAIDVCIPSNAWTTKGTLAVATNQWWLTAGDTDFC